MPFDFKLSGVDDAYIIKNLWPLYVHDLARFERSLPNRHGLVDCDEAITSLAEQGEAMSAWWRNPEALFPYLIFVDDRPAGFNLIATHPCLPKEIEADFVVHEFFVLPAYRGKGVAEQAAAAGFERHGPGWEVVTYPDNPRAGAFWRKAIKNYTSGEFSETEGDHVWGRKTIFTFTTGR